MVGRRESQRARKKLKFDGMRVISKRSQKIRSQVHKRILHGTKAIYVGDENEDKRDMKCYESHTRLRVYWCSELFMLCLGIMGIVGSK